MPRHPYNIETQNHGLENHITDVLFHPIEQHNQYDPQPYEVKCMVMELRFLSIFVTIRLL